MKVSTEFTPERQAIVTVEVDEEQMQGALKRAAQAVSRYRPVPGFRPGKAPYELVERAVGKDLLLDQAIEDLSQTVYRKVLKEGDIQPVDLGSLNVVQKDPPIFKYTIPVKPEVKLGDYKSLHMTPGEPEVTDEEVNQVIERFQLNQATMVPVSRGAQQGDVITVDVVGGVPDQDPLEEKNLRVKIGGDGQVQLPFDSQLIGMNAGERREIDHTYPEDAEDEELRGKTAHYTVTLQDIKETQLPELNDQFVQAISQFQTLDQFKGNIRDILRRQKERDEETRFANSVLDSIVDLSEISYPPVLIDREMEHDVEHLQQDVQRLGLTWDKYLQLSGKSEEQVKEGLRPNAERRLKQLLILGELMDAEDIQVTRDEINADIERRVQESVENGANANTARRSYSAKDARDNIAFSLRVNKTVGKIVAMVKGEPTSGKILTPEMVRGETSPIPTGLITDPRQVREQDWPKGLVQEK